MKKTQYINNNGQYSKEHKEQTMDYSQTKVEKEPYPKIKIQIKNAKEEASKIKKTLNLENTLDKKLKPRSD